MRLRHASTRSLSDCGVVNGSERGQWSLGPGSDLCFDLTHCELRRPTLCQAQHCLSSQSLLFIGDSLTRYMYLSLIYFLSHGEWPDKLGGVANKPSPVVEPQHASWTDFYRSSLATYGGRENCSCFRSNNGSVTTERRHFYDHIVDITVRFFYYPVNASLLAGFTEVEQQGQQRDGRQHYTHTVRSHSPQLCSHSTPMHPSCHYPSSAAYRPSSVLVANVGIWQWMAEAVLRADTSSAAVRSASPCHMEADHSEK